MKKLLFILTFSFICLQVLAQDGLRRAQYETGKGYSPLEEVAKSWFWWIPKVLPLFTLIEKAERELEEL